MKHSRLRQLAPAFFALVVLILFLVMRLLSISGDHTHDLVSPFEPTRLSDLALLGGSTEAPWSFEEMAKRSHVAVVVEVVDVRPSRLNTPDGRFPSAAAIRSQGLSELTVLTDVDVFVGNTLASAGKAPTPGEQMTITVGGGTIFTSLDADQAAALGITAVTVVPAAVAGGLDREVEVPVNGPVDEFMWGTTPEGELVEGEEALLFLEVLAIPSYDIRGSDLRILSPVHSSAMLHRDGSIWVDHNGTTAPVAAMTQHVGG